MWAASCSSCPSSRCTPTAKKAAAPNFWRPEVAIPLYEKFVALCREKGFHTETGEFGAYMQVDSLNDGPLTIILDTDTL